MIDLTRKRALGSVSDGTLDSVEDILLDLRTSGSKWYERMQNSMRL